MVGVVGVASALALASGQLVTITPPCVKPRARRGCVQWEVMQSGMCGRSMCDGETICGLFILRDCAATLL